jgi:2-oxoglutarate ferredoxin oxidoreductase subunit delta
MTKTKGKAVKRAVVEINREWCKGCGICIAFCPKQALTRDERDKAAWSHPENCIACGGCEIRCPDMAIEVRQEQGGPESEDP